MRTVNVIVPCSASKVEAALGSLRVRSLRGKTIEARSREWNRRLASAHLKGYHPALEAYRGQAWAVIRRMLTELSSTLQLNIWIASAGLGLIPPGGRVPCYSATFTGGDPDSVFIGKDAQRNQSDCRFWWQQLGKRNPLRLKGPRSIAALAREYPGTPLIVALSTPYLVALEEDLTAANNALRYRDMLTIFSTRTTTALGDYTLGIDHRMQARVGGSLGTLAVRTLELLLGKAGGSDYSRQTFAEILARETRDLQSVERPNRRRPSEAEILKFIRSALKKDSRISHSALLRQFRDSGLACEYTRFRELYFRVKESIRA